MTNQTLAKGDPAKLKELLNKLEIVISVDEEDGSFTACTKSEPLFCFVRKTEQELEKVVEDTLRSYLETFYDVEGVRVEAVNVPLEKPQIPVKELKPVSRFKPTFTSTNGERRYAIA